MDSKELQEARIRSVLSEFYQNEHVSTAMAIKQIRAIFNEFDKDLKKVANDCFKNQIDPDTSEFECFFHYTDEKIFEAGFLKGYEYSQSNK